MAELLMKGTVFAVQEETVYGAGTSGATPVTGTITSGSDQVIPLPAGAVQPSTIVVSNTTDTTTLTLDTDYTVAAVTATGITTVTVLQAYTDLNNGDGYSIAYGEYADVDVVATSDPSSIDPQINSIERNVMNGSFLKCPTLPGQESVAGTLTVEAVVDTGLGKLKAHRLMKACMGAHEGAASETGGIAIKTASTTKYEQVDVNGTTADIYLEGLVTEASIVVYNGTDTGGTLLVITTDYTVATTGESTVVTILDHTDAAYDVFITYNRAADMIWEVPVGSGITGTYGLYKLTRPGDAATSLAIREYVGGDTDNTYDFNGCVVESAAINVPTSDIVTFEYAVGGIEFETSVDQKLLTRIGCVGNPFVGKRCIFKSDNVALEATNLSFSVTNTVYDSQSVTSDGIVRKIITDKAISGSFQIRYENPDEVDAFKGNQEGEVYFEMVNSDDEEIILYFPRIKRTSVSLSNDSGVYVQDIEFEGFGDSTTGEGVMLAVK